MKWATFSDLPESYVCKYELLGPIDKVQTHGIYIYIYNSNS